MSTCTWPIKLIQIQILDKRLPWCCFYSPGCYKMIKKKIMKWNREVTSSLRYNESTLHIFHWIWCPLLSRKVIFLTTMLRIVLDVYFVTELLIIVMAITLCSLVTLPFSLKLIQKTERRTSCAQAIILLLSKFSLRWFDVRVKVSPPMELQRACSC